MFSSAVQRVANTQIFARLAPDGRQHLAYQMQMSALEDVAMVLPLPVLDRQAPEALKFLDLSDCPEFFACLDRLFPELTAPASFGSTPLRSAPQRELEVVAVGSFEASYVPTLEDFARLSPRFQMPAPVWEQLPGYRDYAFAVFKLKPGQHKVHPMAFSFRTRLDRHLYFPTLHVHDGTVPGRAEFDHQLYMQGSAPQGWSMSSSAFDTVVEHRKAAGLLARGVRGGRLTIRGSHPNADVIVGVGAGVGDQGSPGLRPGLVRKN